MSPLTSRNRKLISQSESSGPAALTHAFAQATDVNAFARWDVR
jgi:hypothetical protein